MAFPVPPNPFDVLANPFAAAQNFVGQAVAALPPLPNGQRVTQFTTAGGSQTVALGDGFVDTQELAQWSNPIQGRIQALEAAKVQEQYAAAYGKSNSGDMMPLMLVLLLGGGLTGTGTTTTSTTTLLLLMMMMGGDKGGFGGGDDSSSMLMMVLLLGGGI